MPFKNNLIYILSHFVRTLSDYCLSLYPIDVPINDDFNDEFRKYFVNFILIKMLPLSQNYNHCIYLKSSPKITK